MTYFGSHRINGILLNHSLCHFFFVIHKFMFLTTDYTYPFEHYINKDTWQCILKSSAGNETFRVSPAHPSQPLLFRVKLIQEQCLYFLWGQTVFLVLCFIIKMALSDFYHFVLLPLIQTSLGDCFRGTRVKNYSWNWKQNTSPHYACVICVGFSETTEGFLSFLLELESWISDHLPLGIHTAHMVHKFAYCPFGINPTVCFRDN